MRIVVIGVEGVDPDILLADPRLVHLRALEEEGIRGRLAAEDCQDGSLLSLAMELTRDRKPTPSGNAPADPMGAELIKGSGARGIALLGDLEGVGRPVRLTIEPREPVGRIASDGSSVDVGDQSQGRRGAIERMPAKSQGSAEIRAIFGSFRGQIQSQPWTVASLVIDVTAIPIEVGERGPAAAIDSLPDLLDGEIGRTLDDLLGMGGQVSFLLVLRRGYPLAEEVLSDATRSTGWFVLSTSLGLPSGEIDGARLVDLAPTLLALAGRPVPEGTVGRPLALEQLAPSDDEDEQAVIERLKGLGYLA